jgi:hypothetical protein
VNGLKHQKEKRSMDHFAGLDVSVKETSVCIVDEAGKQRYIVIAMKSVLFLCTGNYYRSRFAEELFNHRAA